MRYRSITPSRALAEIYFPLLLDTKKYSKLVSEFVAIRSSASLFVWLSLVRSLVSLGHSIEMVLSTLDDMADHIPVEAETYLYTMKAFESRKDMAEAIFALYDHMISAGCLPDKSIYRMLWRITQDHQGDFKDLFVEDEES